jgi:hypothetical protein
MEIPRIFPFSKGILFGISTAVGLVKGKRTQPENQIKVPGSTLSPLP